MEAQKDTFILITKTTENTGYYENPDDGNYTFSKSVGLTTEELLSLKYPDGFPLFFPDHKTIPHLSAVTLLTILDSVDIHVHHIEDNELDQLKNIDKNKIIACGISTTYIYSSEELSSFVDNVKQQFSGTPVIVGGAGISLHTDWFETSNADYFIFSDAEEALPLLIEYLQTGNNFDKIPRLFWKDDDENVQSNRVDEIPDMDTFETTKWDLKNNGMWPPAILYESSRGCPFECGYCSYSLEWKGKSAKKMFEEFMYFSSKGVFILGCFDSSFLTPLKRFEEFARLYSEANAPVKWHAWAHASQLQSKDICDLLVKAGCGGITIGIESGDNSILKNMNKKLNRDQALNAIKNLKEAGLFCATYFIIGFPGETEQTAQNTLSFIKEAQPDLYSIQVFHIRSKNIPVLKNAKQYGLSVEDNGEWSHETMDSKTALKIASNLKADLAMTTNHSACITMSLGGMMYQQFFKISYIDYFRKTIIPIIKEYERSLIVNPEIKLYNSDHETSLELSREYSTNAQALLMKEIKNGNIVKSI